MKRALALTRHPVTLFSLALILLPFVLPQVGGTVSLATEIALFILMALGFNILLGYTGLVSFGHGAYFGLAAYAGALSQIHFFQGRLLLPILVGVLTAAILGLLTGFLILRRRGVYFALLTLAFTQMFFYIVYRWTAVTGGENGLGGLTRPKLLGIDLTDPMVYYYFVLAIAIPSIVLIWRIVRSPFGKVLQAIRENEQRASFVGYNTRRYKLLSFVLSCTFTGLSGVLYAFLIYFVYPQLVEVAFSGEILAMTVVGGMRHFLGPAVGAAFFIFFRDFLSTYTENWLLFFGALFMLFILFSPQGITGLLLKIPWPFRSPQGVPSPFLVRRPGTIGGASEGRTTTSFTDGEEVLVCQGVTKRFGALVAVDRADLVVKRGELRSIIGPNGAGKTTFFNGLTGLIPPDSGKVLFKGQEITKLPPYAIIGKGIARSFQIISIFQELSVFENIRVAVQATSRHRFDLLTRVETLSRINEEAFRIIEEVGLSGKEDSIASSLSHGDQRLLEIGIALATRPELLLLDEPLAGLSAKERARIAELIRRLAGNLTVVLIEHDIDRVLALSDKITVMHQGRVIAKGTPEEIQQNEAVQQAYLGKIRLVAERQEVVAGPKGQRLLLQVEEINTFYGKSHILHNLSLEVKEGEMACLLGRNGAGKTTTLRSIIGATPPKSGRILYQGKEITRWPPEAIARLGMGLVPEGRRIFPNLTVLENLRLASRKREDGRWTLDRIFALFPQLEELKDRKGEHLSGGERQMLAVARALMGNVRFLLLDEPFEGLAPA
ncbi:MAG: ATP-binding cassette domain-containing protein, partial [candidate division NC10 bacterium]|nr:ATP-binding cassette domain-containing protein [candidate division NC10 bacterium]